MVLRRIKLHSYRKPSLIFVLFFCSSVFLGSYMGDTGWSWDGSSYGFCKPGILPDEGGGCFFFDISSHRWREVSRIDALKLWKIWEEEKRGKFNMPVLPVYPLDRQEDTGVVVLRARVTATDEIVSLLEFPDAKRPDLVGSEWEIVFDYSQNGRFLAAGIVRVDFSEPHNSFYIAVMETLKWSAVAKLKAGLDRLSKGDFTGGLLLLAEAELDYRQSARLSDKPAIVEEKNHGSVPIRKPFARGNTGTWVETAARIAWSADGGRLCTCETARSRIGGRRASCRYFVAAEKKWKPVVFEKVKYVCPYDGNRIEDGGGALFPYMFWVDWGCFRDRMVSILYMIEPLKGELVPVKRMERQVVADEEMKPVWRCPVVLPVAGISPHGNMITTGFEWMDRERTFVKFDLSINTVKEFKARFRMSVSQ